MRTTLILVALLALPATAHAGGNPNSWGVGVEYMFEGPGGVSFNYDQGEFHAGGFFGFENDDFTDEAGAETEVELGGRFFWHAHSTAFSDFGLGGIVGYRSVNREDPMEDLSQIFFDLGAQIRVFPGVSNVAFSGTLGVVIGTGDADGVALGGTTVAGLGVHYYFM